ncbi:MAG: Asp-tRNA(Asn)/Glu-tRNA(Gln) amidotransferase subunit GatA, partial [Deltaproteobacteria bacterium]|nr:Asp-tRNA(Asn)/Glu-tRNA(Gln) amidotransferase subunit GatA [Deltaproteobacteria bacterium]
MTLIDLTIHEMRGLLDRGELSATELTEAFLERIEAVDGEINAFILVTALEARQAARNAEQRLKKGDGGALTGIPLGLKDIFITQGVETTCASRILKGFVPPYDGTAVRRLREQDAVFLGKLNMDEFAMG